MRKALDVARDLRAYEDNQRVPEDTFTEAARVIELLVLALARADRALFGADLRTPLQHCDALSVEEVCAELGVTREDTKAPIEDAEAQNGHTEASV